MLIESCLTVLSKKKKKQTTLENRKNIICQNTLYTGIISSSSSSSSTAILNAISANRFFKIELFIFFFLNTSSLSKQNYAAK